MRRALLLGSALLLAACGGEGDALSPVPAAAVTPVAPDAGAVDAGDDEPDGGGPVTTKRTVEQRNPFGHVDEADNLLWDGDFEWHSPFSDQYGWLKGPPLSYAFDGITIGVTCKSGVKCATLAKGKTLVGIGVAAKAALLDASIWVRPSDGKCDAVDVQIIALGSGDPDVSLVADAVDADASGWCRIGGISDERSEKAYLYVKNVSKGDVIVDDAVMRALTVGADAAAKIVAGPPTAERVAELASVRADLRRLRGPHDPPPNAARRALERWRSK